MSGTYEKVVPEQKIIEKNDRVDLAKNFHVSLSLILNFLFKSIRIKRKMN